MVDGWVGLLFLKWTGVACQEQYVQETVLGLSVNSSFYKPIPDACNSASSELYTNHIHVSEYTFYQDD